MPTATENAWIQAFESLGGSLSCAVSLFVAHRVYQERGRNVTNSMLVFLFLVEAGLTLAYAVGRAGLRDAGLCQLQALLVQWFSVMVFLWISLMSYILFQWIVRKKHPKRMEKTIRRGQYAIVCTAFALALALLCANTYGDAYMWCWITDEHTSLRFFCFELILFCSWLVDVFVLVEVHRALDPETHTQRQTETETETLSLVQRCAHCVTATLSRAFSPKDSGNNSKKRLGRKQKQKQRRNTVSERIGYLLNSNLSVQRKLSLHVCVFSFVWFFSILNRFLEFGLGRVVFATALLQAIVVPLQGVLNALIYTDVFHVQEKLSALLFTAGKSRNGKGVPFLGGKTLEETELHEVTIAYPYNNSNTNTNTTNNPILNTNAIANSNNTSNNVYVPKRYSLLITTLNVGESPAAALQSSLKEWILSGHDVYAVGLQECVDLESVREMIHSHLGGPSQYAMFCSSLGSDNTSLGYHGYIALTLFVRVSEIRSGCIHSPRATMNTTATGTDLIIATAQNKGAAGVPLQLHDTHMAFVTCHLPSDSKGKSKLIKRNASAHAILKDVILAPEDLGFDLPLQHDHCFVFGDLNYRMDTNHVGAGVNSLTGVAVACTIEKQVLRGDAHWLQRKYNLLRHTSDPLHPSIDDVKLLIEAKRQSRGAWSSLLRADELRAIMEDGDAFYGFVEPVPCFPPSYKRRKGEREGDCGDYTEFNGILKGFSNTGEVENMLDREREREREKEKDALALLGVDGKRVLKEVGRRINLQKKVSADEIAFVPQTQTQTQAHTQSARVKSGSGDAVEERDTDNNDEEANHEERDADREAQQEREGDVRESESDRASEATGAAHKKRRAAVLGAQPTALAQKSVVDPSKLRPPSYTDRILLHSLPDRASRITVQAYDLCDALRVSDHRAVSMTLLLEVNGAVMYDASGSATHTHAQAAEDNDVDNDNTDDQAVSVPLAEPKFELYELRIADLSVRLLDWTQDDELDENDEEEEGDDDDDENENNDIFAAQKNGNNSNSNTNADGHRSLSRSRSLSFSRSLSMSSQTNTSERTHSIEGVNPLHTRTHAQQRSSQQGLELHAMNNNNDNSNTSRPAVPQRQTSLWRRLSTLGSGNSSGNGRAAPAQRKKSFFSPSPSSTNTVREKREGEEGDLYDVYGPQCGDEEENSTDNASISVSVAETEDKLLRELGDEALAWKTSNAGLWRKRVQEEQRRLQQQKQQQQQSNTDTRMSLSLRGSLKRKNSVNGGSNKQNKNSNKRIDQVTVVFPLPVKDPLLVHRRIYDYSRAFAGEGEPVKRKDMTDLEKNQLYANKDEGTSVIPKEELLRHASVFQWTQSNRLSYAQGLASAEARFSTNAIYKVKGCASPELGAHALIKVSNASGYEFGSSVVCLSHLLHTNPNALHSSVMENIHLSSGGQKRGFISGKFSLRYLPSPLSLDS